MNRIQRLMRWLAIGSLVLATSGCNPVFFNQITAGGYAPLAPGDSPYVLIHLVNNTSFNLTAVIGIQYPNWSSQPSMFTIELLPGIDQGALMSCPVGEIKLGSLTDPTEAAIQYTSETGGQVTIPSSAFPYSLVQGQEFDCGDALVFTIIEDSNSTFGVSVFPGVIPGETQTGSFNGPDTFTNFDTFLQLTSSSIDIVQ